MEEKGVSPDDIRGIEDLHKLPFLSKADLREAYPYGLLGKPLFEAQERFPLRFISFQIASRGPRGPLLS